MIETERLSLVPLALADAAAIVNGVLPSGARWAPGYPMESTLVVAGLMVTAAREGGAPPPFGGYQVVRRSDRVVIGDCGFISPPDAHGDVHVDCAIVAGERGKGYATEALSALVAFAHARPEVRRVLAEGASGPAQRLLERVGMREYDRRRRMVYYEG